MNKDWFQKKVKDTEQFLELLSQMQGTKIGSVAQLVRVPP